MSGTDDLDPQWYWDRRTETAYYPIDRDGEHVTFATVWHAEEVADARQAGALVPIEDLGSERTNPVRGLLESFRLPEPEDLPGGG
jgi:hypothetical protein